MDSDEPGVVPAERIPGTTAGRAWKGSDGDGGQQLTAISSSGRWIAVGSEDATIRVTDITSGQVEELQLPELGSSATAMEFDASETVLGVADRVGHVALFGWTNRNHTESLATRSFQGHSDPITTLRFSHDGQWCAVSGWNGEIPQPKEQSRCQQLSIFSECP